MTDDNRILPAHIEDTVASIAKLHEEHYRGATPIQRLVDRMTGFIGRPPSIAVLTGVVVVWMGGNVLAGSAGWRIIDPPPFSWLQGLVSLGALYATFLILITQRREDELASQREQLTLELAILGEKKSAKIIELLEEMRRDHPDLRDRHDAEAADMAKPSDPESMVQTIGDPLLKMPDD